MIAHSVSAMVVQTAAAQDLLRSSPDRAAELLQSVADTGRHALDETGRLLRLIRDDADELGLHPAPGLGDVAALIDTFRGNGLPVEARLDLPHRDLPSGLDVSAYRVVQELLTNALRYSDGPVTLVVSAGPDRLRISCANPVGPGGEVAGSGLGLQGIGLRGNFACPRPIGSQAEASRPPGGRCHTSVVLTSHSHLRGLLEVTCAGVLWGTGA